MIPWLIMIRGYPGSGKSVLAQNIKAKIINNCILLDPDGIKKENLDRFCRKYRFRSSNDNRKYRYNFSLAGEKLEKGENVVWDQPFRTFRLLRLCIDRLKSFGVKFKLLLIELEINKSVAWQRVQKRKKKGGHGPNERKFIQMCKEHEPADPDEFNIIKVDANRNKRDMIKEVDKCLKKDSGMKQLNIYLIRHLATEYNKKGVYMGRLLDPPILKEEKRSFVKTIDKLNLTSLNSSEVLFYSSPAKRCLETINLLQDAFKTSGAAEKLEEFNETNYGLFSGKTAREIKNKFPDIFRLWMEKPAKVRFPEGEEYKDVQRRAYSKLFGLIKKAIEDNHAIENIFICTHVDVIKLILCKILSLPLKRRRLFRIDFGSFSCLQSISKAIDIKYVNYK